ncbi:MAG: choice-of-anchor E domain-containing protein, partial [Isosphaeraceae bacterium]
MLHRHFSFPCLAVFAALLLAAPTLSRPAIGQVVVLGTQTASFNNQASELNGSPILTLNQFNGAGTLTRVQISASGSATSSGTVTNTAALAQ